MALQRSYALLTMHKAGSSFVGDILKTVYSSNGFKTYDLTIGAFEQGISEVDYIRSRSDIFLSDRCFFGPFRTDTCELVSRLEAILPILHVRDPRDCLVSMYYSLAYSHPVPGPGPIRDSFLAERKAIQALSVDDFVSQVLDWYVSLAFGVLRNIAVRRPNHILSRYEDMVTEFPHWLDRLLLEADLQISPSLRQSVLENATFEVEEDIYRHKRQVTPEDFRRKLSKPIQHKLTEAFEVDLRFFGYAL